MADESTNAAASDEPTRPSAPRLTEDSAGLGPLCVSPFTVGLVDIIAGKGGVEVAGFVATKDELLQLARYWATEILNLDFTYFLYQCTGSSEWRTSLFARRRLDRIADLIGTQEVSNAFNEAEQAFARTVERRAWRIFKSGSPEERERFQEEVQERMASDTDEERK